MPYLKGGTPSHLEAYVPKVITAFITSRMEMVVAQLEDGDAGADGDGDLDDDDQLTEQLDTLPALCRFQLPQVCTCPLSPLYLPSISPAPPQVSSYLVSLFEPSARHYAAALAQPASERTGNAAVRRRLSQSEGELAWLIYIIGQILGSHNTPNSNAEDQQMVGGEITVYIVSRRGLHSISARCTYGGGHFSAGARCSTLASSGTLWYRSRPTPA